MTRNAHETIHFHKTPLESSFKRCLQALKHCLQGCQVEGCILYNAIYERIHVGVIHCITKYVRKLDRCNLLITRLVDDHTVTGSIPCNGSGKLFAHVSL